MSGKENIIINLDNIDTNTKETDELRWRLQEEAYGKIRELFKEYNDKMPKEPQDISECRTRNTALIVGGRGSGKTYFLLNISKYLKKTDEPKKSDEKIADNFHFFAPIDPTLLHKNENFLTVILAKILNELEKRKCDEKLNDEDKRKFYEKLAQVAEAIDGFDGERKNAFQIISSDQSGLRLEQYIHEFFGLVSKTLGNKQLVLLIDDVDMAFEKGYEVLETVRKYLASPYVISVVTGDMCLYERIIHKEFADNLSLKQKELDGYMEEGAERLCREGKKEFVVKLAEDYLGKLFEHKARAKLKSFKELGECAGNNTEGGGGRQNITLSYDGVSMSLCEYRKAMEDVAQTITKKIFDEFSLRKFLSFAKETLKKTSEYKESANAVTLKPLEDLLLELDKIYLLGFDVSESYLEKGERLLAIDENDKAIEAYKKAIGINSKSEVAYFRLGVAYTHKNDNNNAIKAYEKAIEINPKLDGVYVNLGATYAREKKYDKAIETLQKAVEINPKSERAYIGLGATYADKKEYNEAIEAYQKAIEINPEIIKAYPAICVTYIDLLQEQLIRQNKMLFETVENFKKNVKDKEYLKIFSMLEILQNFKGAGSFVMKLGRWKDEFEGAKATGDFKGEASFEMELERWKEEFEGTKADWDFKELSDWAETLEEGKKELIKKAIEAFKPYFNN